MIGKSRHNMNDFNFVIVDIVNNVIPSTESAIVLSNSFFQVAQLVSVSCSTRRAELPNSRFRAAGLAETGRAGFDNGVLHTINSNVQKYSGGAGFRSGFNISSGAEEKTRAASPVLECRAEPPFLRPYAGKTGGGGRKTEKIIPYPSHTMECTCGGLQTFAT